MAELTLEEKIIEAIEDIRPYLQGHGGDVEFISYEKDKKTVNVKLQGACHGCASAQMTLKNGIQNVLVEIFPDDVENVESV